VHFVRGPMTAQAIGVDKAKGISDPVLLLNRWIPLVSKKRLFVVSCGNPV